MATPTDKLIKIRDGEVVLYRRGVSPKWQVRYKLPDNKWHRTSTRRTQLDEAKRVAGEAYDKARFRHSEGLNAVSRRFRDVAKLTIAKMDQAVQAGKGTFSSHTEVAFISLNPGGDIDLPDHPHESSEQGSAYLIECWKGKAAGTENLQIQFQRLATTLQQHFGDKSSLADYINTKILTAHFIPFRSQRFKTLHARAESIKFGRKLWKRIFKFILPSTIVTLDPHTFGAMSEIIASSGGVLLSKEKFQTGWGFGSSRPIGCEVRKYRQAAKVVTILRLPHLSTFKLFSNEKCAPYLSEIFGYVCREHPPLVTFSHGS